MSSSSLKSLGKRRLDEAQYQAFWPNKKHRQQDDSPQQRGSSELDSNVTTTEPRYQFAILEGQEPEKVIVSGSEDFYHNESPPESPPEASLADRKAWQEADGPARRWFDHPETMEHLSRFQTLAAERLAKGTPSPSLSPPKFFTELRWEGPSEVQWQVPVRVEPTMDAAAMVAEAVENTHRELARILGSDAGEWMKTRPAPHSSVTEVSKRGPTDPGERSPNISTTNEHPGQGSSRDIPIEISSAEEDDGDDEWSESGAGAGGANGADDPSEHNDSNHHTPSISSSSSSSNSSDGEDSTPSPAPRTTFLTTNTRPGSYRTPS
ncbi:MAG: hypothetical protein Q9222_005358, partial [Ikaeria aurantiellina]